MDILISSLTHSNSCVQAHQYQAYNRRRHSTSGTLYSQRLLRVMPFSFDNSAVPSTGGNLSLRHRVSKDANHFHPPPGKATEADLFQHKPHPDKLDPIFWPENMVPHFPANVNSFFSLSLSVWLFRPQKTAHKS